MSDSYQAIYDAVRSKISGGNIGDVVERVCRDAFDMGNMRAILTEQFCSTAIEMARPSVLFKPTLTEDGDMWCALLGDDLASGLAGFGRTPADAMTAFDQAFYKQRTSTAIRLESMLEAKAANSQFGVGA
jgi:hypothetical protein